MNKTQVVTVGQRTYDAATGLPLENAIPTRVTRQSLRSQAKQPTAAQPPVNTPVAQTTSNTGIVNQRSTSSSIVNAKQMHASPQRSKTLNRQFVKRPTPTPTPSVAQPVTPSKQTVVQTRTPQQPQPVQSKPVTLQTQAAKAIVNNTPAAAPVKTPVDKASTTIVPPKQPPQPKPVATNPVAATVKPTAAPSAKPAPQPMTTAPKTSTAPLRQRAIGRPVITTPTRVISDIQPRRVATNPQVTTQQQTAHLAPQRRNEAIINPLSKTDLPEARPVADKLNNTLGDPISAPIDHPIAKQAQSIQSQKKAAATEQPVTFKPAQQVKEERITEALEEAPMHTPRQVEQPKPKRRKKLFGLFALIALLGTLSGYTAYTYIPAMSMGVANAKAGIEAHYPGYIPSGYKVNGPIASTSGQVRIYFASTTSSATFQLTQVQSTWDSKALLDNYVRSKSQGDYHKSHQKGITIYSYSGNGAWVNGGLLYVIEGNAPLSPDQIQRIATSV